MKVIIQERLARPELTVSQSGLKHSEYRDNVTKDSRLMITAEPGYQLSAVFLLEDDAADIPAAEETVKPADDVLAALFDDGGFNYPLFDNASMSLKRRGIEILLQDGRTILLQAWNVKPE